MWRKTFAYMVWSIAAVFIGGSTVALPRFATNAFPAPPVLTDGRAGSSEMLTFSAVSKPDFAEENPAQHIATLPPPSPLLAPYQTRTIAAMSFAIPKEGKAILADLGEMTLKLYENGNVRAEYPILSKGKPGSLWETPTGSYSIQTKEERHYSTIGDVWMPWSMQFFGNFFIHGWPSYGDGMPVPPGFSGGCIRLGGKDAQELFDQATLGVPVFVTNGSGFLPLLASDKQDKDFFGYIAKESFRQPPLLSAESAFAADLETGFVFFEKESSLARPIASLSKLMTALVSLEAINQYQTITIQPEDVAAEGTAGGLVAGQKLQSSALLFPLLLSSSNDAAYALARAVGIDRFVGLMNEKARSLGFVNTVFVEPSGLNAKNQSTPEDLFRLLQYLWTNRRSVLDITKERDHASWRNIHPFAASESFLGGKTGFIPEAKRTMAAIFNLPVGEFASRPIAIVALGSDHIQRDVERLRLWVKHNFEYGIPLSQEQKLVLAAAKKNVKHSVSDISNASSVSLLFVGDIMLDRGVKEKIMTVRGGDFSFLFQYARDSIKEADIAFANLEGPVSDKGEKKGSIYSFRMDPAAIHALKDVGFDVLSLANNHMGDWGREAFEDTMRRLRKASVAYAGAGWNTQEAHQAVTIEKNGVAIGYLAFSGVGPEWMRAEEAYSGIALASVESVTKAVREAKEHNDIVVASFHFGDEYKKEPNESQRVLARAAIDAGAKVVIGHHPHVIQPIEEYHGGVIAYSLGNFIFDQSFSDDTMEGMMLEVELEGDEIHAIIPHVVKLNEYYQPVIEL